jgi:hypothetical protein
VIATTIGIRTLTDYSIWLEDHQQDVSPGGSRQCLGGFATCPFAHLGFLVLL